jgi:hypothetical protein
MTHPTDPIVMRGLASIAVRRLAAESPETFSRHRDLGHFEDDVAAMAHNLGANLDQLLFQARLGFRYTQVPLTRDDRTDIDDRAGRVLYAAHYLTSFVHSRKAVRAVGRDRVPT